MDAGAARELSHSLLAEQLPRRWAHSQGVARQAANLRGTFGERGALLESAAWLHDVGYAPSLALSGFHPLDGARYLRDVGFGGRELWTLVAHHSLALVEASERDLDDALADEFPIHDADDLLLTALTYCDMTTSPDGEPHDVDQRLDEILTRYPADHIVHRSISRAAPTIRAQVGEIMRLLEKA